MPYSMKNVVSVNLFRLIELSILSLLLLYFIYQRLGELASKG